MIADFLGGVFAGLWLYIMLVVIGAVVGGGAYLLGRLAGLPAAAAFGAVALVAAYVSNVVDEFADDRAQARIEQLEAENKAKAAKIAEIRAVNEELNDYLEIEQAAAVHNAEVIARLEAKIDAQDDRPECAIGKDILDELENLR